MNPSSDEALTAILLGLFSLFVSLGPTSCTHMHLQPPRQSSVPHAPNVVPSRNPANPLVVVAVVLGLETVEVVVTQSLVTRGLRAFGPAKHERS